MTEGTNVLVPESALEALEQIRLERGYRSRNQTVRELLEEYAIDQQVRAPEQRLMHVATLMRYPRPRRKEWTPRQGGGVQLRVPVDRQFWDTVRALAFRLPGQAAVRGHRDYQARPGTDAVLTAIARVRPLEDPVLGAHQVLTHRQAHGLWRIVVDITRSRREKHVLELAAHDARVRAEATPPGAELTHAERVAHELEQRVDWHGWQRFDVARAIIVEQLDGDSASAFLHELEVQDRDSATDWLFVLGRFDRLGYDQLVVDEFDRFWPMEGRGANAVWRAERAVAGGDIVAWLRRTGRNSTPRTLWVDPPKWRLRLPSPWIPTVFPRSAVLPPQWADHVRTGRVLHWAGEREHLLWPTRDTADGTTEPIPGIEAVTRHLHAHPEWRIAEVLLLELQSARTDGFSVQVPAHIAYDVGLIGAEERDTCVARARARAVRSETMWGPITSEEPAGVKDSRPVMDHDVVFADLHDLHPDAAQRREARMAYAHGQRSFVRYLGAIEYPQYSTHWFNWTDDPQWSWPVASLADAVAAGDLEPGVLVWLAAYVLTTQDAIIFSDMNNRWIQAASYSSRDGSSEQPCPVDWSAAMAANRWGEDDEDRAVLTPEHTLPPRLSSTRHSPQR